jgi:hypothetical protein
MNIMPQLLRLLPYAAWSFGCSFTHGWARPDGVACREERPRTQANQPGPTTVPTSRRGVTFPLTRFAESYGAPVLSR